MWDRATGEYCGKAHKYKRSAEYGQYTCFAYEWEARAKDEKSNLKETRPRNTITKKWYLEENPDEKDCIHCKEPVMWEEFRDAVRDHCYITGEYIGAEHNACNLKLRIYPKSVVIPVVAAQSQKLRRSSHNAGDWKGCGRTEVYSQQHGELRNLLIGKAKVYRQLPASVKRVGRASCIKKQR